MADLIPVSYKLLKGMNESLILSVIRKNKYISRSDIAKITNLTPPTVTNIINKLIDNGLVKEDKIGESNGGRPPVFLKINSKAFNIILVLIGTNTMKYYLVDAEIKSLKIKSSSIKNKEGELIIQELIETINEFKKVSKSKVAGIGVVVRGPVKSYEGISVFSPNIGWRNVPIKKIIEKECRIPLFLENDVRAMALGEFYNDAAKDVEDMIFLKVGYGIGSTIIINGKIYRGKNEMAGEIGHTTLDISGSLCSCGNYGCFETLASEKALVNNVIKRIKEGSQSLVLDYVDGDIENIEPEIIYKAAAKNDKVSLNELSNVARYLGIGISNIINIFNPELVVIAGGIVRARQYIEEILFRTIENRALEGSYTGCRIEFSNPNYDAAFVGIENIVLDSIL